jgi:hypothetical protein
MDVALPLDVTMTVVMMIAAEVDAMEVGVMIIADTVGMIVTVVMAEIATMDMVLVEVTDMLVMIDTAAVVVTTDVEVAVDTLIVMIEVTVALVGTHHQQPPMVIQHLAEKVGNHMEVEATMMRDHLVASIDC